MTTLTVSDSAKPVLPDVTSRPLGTGWKGSGLITWYALWKTLTNPFQLGFAIGLPIMMYLMFGSGREYSDIWMGHANVAASVLVNMAAYGTIMTNSSMGANVALERVSGVSRLYALTPFSPVATIITRVMASMTVCVVVIAITFTVGRFTGARMELGIWFGSFLMIIALSALPAAMGLAMAFAVRSDSAFAATSALTVLASFASGMFIPLDQMGQFWADLAPWTPFYGLVAMAQCPLFGLEHFEVKWLANYLVWTGLFAALAIWSQRRDTGR